MYYVVIILLWSTTLCNAQAGRVFSWGDKSQKTVNNRQCSPIKVDTTNLAQKFVAITAGYYHSLILDSQGTVYSFGKGSSGQLGAGKNVNDIAYAPVMADYTGALKNTRAVQIAAGKEYSLVLADDALGRRFLFGFGANTYGKESFYCVSTV
jgi:alpha-tubulin suppressor-like RCC1 family protein